MSALADALRVPFQALVVALAGVGLAWLWFHGHRVEGVALTVVALVLGVVSNGVGKGCLPKRPVLGLYFLEGWLLIPMAIAVAAAAAVVIIGVQLTLPDGTAETTKGIVGGASTGITTFLTAAFISWSGDDADSTLADHIQGVFQDKYTVQGQRKPGAHPFPADSAGEAWVFATNTGGISGWGGAARRKRAKGIATALSS